MKVKIATKPSFKEEKVLWKKGFKYVIGIDEVGRGCFAGPVVTSAVCFRADIDESLLREVNDSKQLKFMQRKKLSEEIKKNSCFWSIGLAGVSIINKVGIGKATKIAFRKALKEIIEKTGEEKSFVLVDGFYVKHIKGVSLKNQKAIIKGDQKSFSIAAASIIAKNYRDQIMRRLSKKYPEYLFGQNKGYGTKKHQQAIKKYGLCKIHRKSFRLDKFL